jgi:hypothetical protein
MLLEKIHVLVHESSVENYSEILDKLTKMNLNFRKKFYGIYRILLADMEELMLNRNINCIGIFESSNSECEYLTENEDIKLFLSTRVFEESNIYVDDVWLNNIDKMLEELEFFDNKKIIELYVRTHLLLNLLESQILLEDEYWYPHSFYSLFLLKDSGYSFYREKERIWQPKTGK